MLSHLQSFSKVDLKYLDHDVVLTWLGSGKRPAVIQLTGAMFAASARR